jgi:sugar phosphate isomerase/epimerase
MTQTIKDRIGIDIGRRLPLEPGVDWAIANGIRHIDICLDADHELLRDGAKRLGAAQARLVEAGIVPGLHTLSAVNVAEGSPYISEATDEYLKAYVRAAQQFGAKWIVVHAGYHFTGDKKVRMESALERLKRISDYAERQGVMLLLENMNPEPADAEVKYLAHDLEECHYFFGRLDSPNLRWSFTVNHAHILPVGIEGFLDQMDIERCGEVRIADCRGTVEEHLRIGEGTIDFPAMFALLEGRGYRGHYMLAYTTLDDMKVDREKLAAMAAMAARPQ